MSKKTKSGKSVPKTVQKAQAVSTAVNLSGTRVSKAPAWMQAPDPNKQAREEMRAYLDTRKMAEEAAIRVGSPLDVGSAKDSTRRGFRNLMRKHYGG